MRNEANPSAIVIELGVPDADLVLTSQSIDIAYTILETGIGARACALDIQQVYVGDLPEDPSAQGYIELPELASYIAWRKSNQPTE